MVGFKKSLLLSGWLALFLALTASAQEKTPATINSISAPLGSVFKVPNLLVKEQNRLIIYRAEADAKQGGRSGAVSVFIDGAYQASVQQGAFTELCLPPGPIEVSARYVHNQQDVRDAFDVVNSLILKGGEETFVKVVESPTNRAILTVIHPERALPELVKTHAQKHTISRVYKAQDCRDLPRSEVPAVTPVAVRRITLGADALFAFGKSDIASIPPNGRRILDHLVDRIRTEFGSGKDVQMHIVGHADRFGTEATNMRLSKERADTVKAYLVQGGLLASGITTEGQGDKDPMVNTCSTVYSPTSVACNKPNRRVVLEVRRKPVTDANN